MAGRYESWSMSGEMRDHARSRLDESLYGDVPGADDFAGLEGQVGRDRLIRDMAGTTDKSSTAWKTARDTLQRYRQGTRGIGSKNGERLRNIGRTERQERARRGPVEVTIKGDFKTSGKKWNNGRVGATLTGSAADEFFAAVDAGDSELAMQIAMDEYGLDPDRVEGIDNLSSFDVDFAD